MCLTTIGEVCLTCNPVAVTDLHHRTAIAKDLRPSHFARYYLACLRPHSFIPSSERPTIGQPMQEWNLRQLFHFV